MRKEWHLILDSKGSSYISVILINDIFIALPYFCMNGLEVPAANYIPNKYIYSVIKKEIC